MHTHTNTQKKKKENKEKKINIIIKKGTRKLENTPSHLLL